jgi:hypothetical protein
MVRIDFTSQEYLRDAVAVLAKLTAAGPVVQVRFPIVGKTWIRPWIRNDREVVQIVVQPSRVNRQLRRKWLILLVPRGGIEPPTLRFSVACSTN